MAYLTLCKDQQVFSLHILGKVSLLPIRYYVKKYITREYNLILLTCLLQPVCLKLIHSLSFDEGFNKFYDFCIRIFTSLSNTTSMKQVYAYV
jgi:hypothetical protein